MRCLRTAIYFSLNLIFCDSFVLFCSGKYSGDARTDRDTINTKLKQRNDAATRVPVNLLVLLRVRMTAYFAKLEAAQRSLPTITVADNKIKDGVRCCGPGSF